MPSSSLARSNCAVAAPAQDDVLTDAQDGEVDEPVAVDVERVGAGDRGEVGDGGRLRA